ncbi:MAG: SusD/RagB family nutrient-binding outer membrane lipoprotein [Prevotellaceae bacterium]|nr:SusD/RagB family nutrient-binding outer membrane lipoprotein [Prevotellaceae bacterium]
MALAAFSCTDQLNEINANPNATEKPQAAYLLTGVEKQGADLYWGTYYNLSSTLLFVQHWARIQYPEPDRYEFSNTSAELTTLWNTGYATLVTDLNTIIAFPNEEANSNYKGIAQILRSWVFLLLTDTYGDIPYSEVGKTLVPKYDKQQDVYTGLLDELSQAAALLDASNGSISGDVIYKGDVAKWGKLAHSLRLRIALRIADRDDNLAKQTIASLNVADLIASNDETFQFTFGSSPQHNPQSAHFDTRDDYRISKTIVDKLITLNDPRLPVYAQLPSDTSVYIGAGNGLSNSAAQNQGLSKTSLPGAYFLQPNAPAVIYSYSEVLFNLAEAVARTYISGNAEDYYKQAITASLNQFKITNATDINTYLAQPSVQYDAANYKRAIGEQKWIALFGQGPEAFTELRRLDYPQLTAGPASVLEGKIPVRFFYPGTEQSLNKDNHAAAVASQGVDLLTTKLWFDVN